MTLLDPVHASLNRFARAMARDREEARDLVSETITIAWERFESIDDPRAFLSFLFTIAHRTCIRGRRRRSLFGFLDEGVEKALPSSTTSPEVSADVAALHRALGQLPPAQREAVALFELSGLTLEEIRTIQGGTLSGVKARVARGRRKLSRLLGVEDRSRRDVRPNAPAALPEADNGASTLMLYTAGGTHG